MGAHNNRPILEAADGSYLRSLDDEGEAERLLAWGRVERISPLGKRPLRLRLKAVLHRSPTAITANQSKKCAELLSDTLTREDFSGLGYDAATNTTCFREFVQQVGTAQIQKLNRTPVQKAPGKLSNGKEYKVQLRSPSQHDLELLEKVKLTRPKK